MPYISNANVTYNITPKEDLSTKFDMIFYLQLLHQMVLKLFLDSRHYIRTCDTERADKPGENRSDEQYKALS